MAVTRQSLDGSASYGTAGIAADETESDVIDCGELRFGGFTTPAAFTGATVSFNVGFAPDALLPLYDDTNARYTITVDTERAYSVELLHFKAWRYVQLVSASSEEEAREIGVALVRI